MQRTESPEDRAARLAEFVKDRVLTARAGRQRFFEANADSPAEPFDLADLLGPDVAKLEAWRDEARAAHAGDIERLRTRARQWQAGSVPKARSIFPLDKRRDSKSLPLCLSTPTAIEFSDRVNGTGDLTKASLIFDCSSSGIGGPIGIEAAPAVPPQTASFWYGFFPPAGGTLFVHGALDFLGYLSGRKWTSSAFRRWLFKNPALFPGIYARSWVDMYIRLYQYGTFYPQTARIPVWRHEMNSFWGTEVRIIPGQVFSTVLAAQIVPDEPVAIEMGLEFDADGHSDFCTAEVSAYDRGLVVEALCLNLLPPEVIL